MNHSRQSLHAILTVVGLLAGFAITAPAVAEVETAERELTLHGFRSPSTGVELRDGWLGFHVGAFPLIADEGRDGSRTTWFLKTGLTAYPWRLNLGSDRPSGPFVSVSLMQGMNNEWDVAISAKRGTGIHGEAGFRWAVGAGLDLRLGAGVLVGSDNRVVVHPTPGIGWSVVL